MIERQRTNGSGSLRKYRLTTNCTGHIKTPSASSFNLDVTCCVGSDACKQQVALWLSVHSLSCKVGILNPNLGLTLTRYPFRFDTMNTVVEMQVIIP